MIPRPRPITHGSVAITLGWRVAVAPSYRPDQSDPTEPRYVWTYRIRILNETDRPATLLSRRWLIVDGLGNQRAVEGEGVVGQQPLIAPGHGFEYSSYCPLPTPWGTMEGMYRMRGHDRREFDIAIGKFFLMGPEG